MCGAGEEAAEDAEEGGVGLRLGCSMADGRAGGCRWGYGGALFVGWNGGGCEEGGEGLLDGRAEGRNDAGCVDCGGGGGIGGICCSVEIGDGGGGVADEPDDCVDEIEPEEFVEGEIGFADLTVGRLSSVGKGFGCSI